MANDLSELTCNFHKISTAAKRSPGTISMPENCSGYPHPPETSCKLSNGLRAYSTRLKGLNLFLTWKSSAGTLAQQKCCKYLHRPKVNSLGNLLQDPLLVAKIALSVVKNGLEVINNGLWFVMTKTRMENYLEREVQENEGSVCVVKEYARS